MSDDPGFTVPGIEGRLSLSLPGMFRGAALLLDGVAPPAGPERGTVLLPRVGGGVATARIKSGLFELTPTIEVDGVPVEVGPRVPTWLSALTILPMGLLFVGGALGGLLGGLAVTVNQRIARGSLSTPLKELAVLAVGAAAAVVWMVAATAIQLAVRRH